MQRDRAASGRSEASPRSSGPNGQARDRYASFANSRPGRTLVTRLGLPVPPRLRRYSPGGPEVAGPVLVGGEGRVADAVRGLVGVPDGERHGGLVFDATAVVGSPQLASAYEFFAPVIRTLTPCGRVVVFGTPPARCADPGASAAQQALDGFVRSLAKELGGRGSTANLVYVTPGAEEAIGSTLRFLLSARSAYVSGQAVTVTAPVPVPSTVDETARVAVVTGAARGIGAAIARVLAREGARIVAVDVPAAGEQLSTVANDVHGTALQLDLTAPDAPQRLVRHLTERHGRLDVLVHNAGITRDRTLARMTPAEWASVLAVNLTSQELIDEAVLAGDLMSGGRIVSLASVSGIAGNRGQANYAAAKAGVLGRVRALAPVLRERGITVNAVAPGFIETRMTAAMPALLREAGRRMNSLAQGGLPVDVAEAVGWLAAPDSGGVTGTVVRVCGQSLLGA